MGTYKVQPGDTLDGISQQTGSDVSTIQGINGLDGATIQPGQNLNTSYDAKDMSITGVGDPMLMESGTYMPQGVKHSEMQGNLDKITTPHGKDNKTIGFGIDLQQNPRMGQQVLRRAGATAEQARRAAMGDSTLELPEEVVRKASDLMYSYKYNQAKKIIPNFNKLSSQDQELLVDMHYSGAIKKSGYLKHDQTRKAIWDKLKKGDIDGMKNLIVHSNEPYAKQLRARLEDRGQYMLMNKDEYYTIGKHADDLLNAGKIEEATAFLRSQNKSFKHILSQTLGYNGREGEIRKLVGLETTGEAMRNRQPY